MKWLTIEYIKTHSRIDYDYEDAELEMLGKSAENTVLQVIGRTLNNIKDMSGGEVPAELFHAALMLTDLGYLQHNPVTFTNLSVVPFTLEMKIADWIRHTDGTDIQAERDTLLDMLLDVKSNLDFAYGEVSEPTVEQATLYTSLMSEIEETFAKYSAIDKPTDKICASLRTEVASIKEDCETAFGE